MCLETDSNEKVSRKVQDRSHSLRTITDFSEIDLDPTAGHLLEVFSFCTKRRLLMTGYYQAFLLQKN